MTRSSQLAIALFGTLRRGPLVILAAVIAVFAPADLVLGGNVRAFVDGAGNLRVNGDHDRNGNRVQISMSATGQLGPTYLVRGGLGTTINNLPEVHLPVVEVERDLTHYGEEVKFGGGKVIRDGMGQSQVTRKGGAVDTVITNALVIDVAGIYKADIGLKDGRICAIGKAGNPDTQPDVDIIIGPGTEAIAAEGHILTAGGFDSHIHFICPQQIDDALHSGLTTMLGGGTGPAHGPLATT